MKPRLEKRASEGVLEVEILAVSDNLPLLLPVGGVGWRDLVLDEEDEVAVVVIEA